MGQVLTMSQGLANQQQKISNENYTSHESDFPYTNTIYDNCKFTHKVYDKCTFDNLTYIHSSLSKNAVISCNYTNSNFIDTFFNDIAITHTQFKNCNFDNVIFDNVYLSNVTFDNCTFDLCKFDDCEHDNQISVYIGNKLGYYIKGFNGNCVIKNTKFYVKNTYQQYNNDSFINIILDSKCETTNVYCTIK